MAQHTLTTIVFVNEGWLRESVVVGPPVLGWGNQLGTDKLETLVASSSIKPGTHRHQGFEQKPVVAWFNTTRGCTTTSGWTTSWELMPPSRGL